MEAGDFELIIEGLERILSDPSLSADAEALWSALEDNGYLLLCVSEEHGGIGADLAGISHIAQLVGRFAVPLPLADTVLANGLLSFAGIEPPGGKLSLIDPIEPSAGISYGAQAHSAVSLMNGMVALYDRGSAKIQSVPDFEDAMGMPQEIQIDPKWAKMAPTCLKPDSFRAVCALMRAAQMAGAMQAVLDLTLSYTQDREQFGRPLAKFQAIQHHLSDIACETAASIAAIELATDALRADPSMAPTTITDLAIAKIRCGEAASRVAAAAHQAHGAMGFTFEYALGRYTRRLWQWQDEFGSESEWAIKLGRGILAEEQPQLWPHVSRAI